MKKFFTLMTIAAVMASCNDSKNEETPEVIADSATMDAMNASKMADSAMRMNAASDSTAQAMRLATDSAGKVISEKKEEASDLMKKASDKMENASDKMQEASDKMKKKP